MKTNKLSIGCLGLAVYACFVVAGCSRTESPTSPSLAEWEKFHYQKVEGPKSRMFDISFKFSFDKTRKTLHARTLFNLQDNQRYYYVDFNEEGIQIGRVEGGLELPMGVRWKWETIPYEGANILIKRKESRIAVAVDNAIRLVTYDDTFTGGDIACGAVDNSASFKEFRIQPVGEIYFSEDFMRAEYDQGPWEVVSGSWRVNAIQTPSLSSNAFYFIGSSKEKNRATCVAGQWFWDDYTVAVSCKPLDSAPVGLYFYYTNPDNYFLLRWGARNSDTPKVQLIKRRGGEEKILAEKNGGFQVGQWYRLEASVHGTSAIISIDRNPIFTIEDEALCCGKIGLAVEGEIGARFDDVEVKSTKRFRDSFAREVPGKWIPIGGEWKLVAKPDGTNCFSVSTLESAAKAVAGEPSWHNYTLSTVMEPWKSGAAGLCFYYQDERNYYLFKWERGRKERRSLIKLVEGKEEVLASDELESEPARHEVTITNDGGLITVLVDGGKVFEVWDCSLDEGKIALYAEKAPSVSFDEVDVSFAREKLSMMTVHEAFSREKSMEEWASDQSDWLSRSDIIEGQVGETCWHKAEFFGDVDIEVKKIPVPSSESLFRLLVAGDGQFATSGYALEISAKKGLRVALYRKKELVAEKPISADEEIRNIRFRKAGNHIAAFLSKKCILTYNDPNPLTGTKVGWTIVSLPVKKRDIEVYSDNVYNYAFRRAPADWRVASGVWEVTNRWECDPRWSFFSGQSPALAAIWNKGIFEGDIALEFYGAIKMDQSRGRRYEYASDLNLTLCADGQNLTSGYNFLFGGWKNTRTAIVRQGKVVAEKFFRIPVETNIHRRWFYLKAIKKGNNLQFWIDNNLIISYNDPNPLTGNYVAIWTYNNGIMVSRVRISCATRKGMESPFITHPEKCLSVYDVVKR